MPQIDIINITRRYSHRETAAVAGVSLQVQPTKLLALLGPSGSGKSTILKLVAGIEQPDAGDIRIGQQSMLHVPAHRRGAVLMFQKAYLFPFLTVAENIAFGMRLQNASSTAMRDEVQRLLTLVELPGMQQRRPAHLSGGEQQRVALARALAVRPRVLLLDEPFSSLDPAVRQTLQEAVRRIQHELGITTVLVTHDRSEALAMADQVALLEQGRLIAHATPRCLYERPPTVQAARQMGIDSFLYGQVDGTLFACQLGTFTLAEPAAQIGPAIYAIRPEHIRLLDQIEHNCVGCIMQSVTFRGDQSECVVVAHGQKLRVRVAHPCRYAPGDQLFLQLPAANLFAVQNGSFDPDYGFDC